MGDEKRPRYWAWGLAGWVGITALCLLTHLGSLETNLAERSQIALMEAGLAGQITEGEISFTGEIATLRGSVNDSLVRAQVAAVVEDVRGVRRIENEITVAPVAAAETPAPAVPTTTAVPPPVALRLPSMSAVVDSATITLSGEVPSQDVAEAWLAAATSAYGAGNVVDQLTVTEEVGSQDWLAAAASLRLLESTSGGSIAIRNDAMVVTGLVADQAAHDEVLSALVAAFPNVTIDDRLEIAPQASDEIAALDLTGIQFESGSATITPESTSTLDRATEVLAAFPNVAVEIAGHTDSDGSSAANLALSQARANAVLTYLVEAGIAAERLTAVGYGENEPIADNATPDGKAQNRRIELVTTEGE